MKKILLITAFAPNIKTAPGKSTYKLIEDLSKNFVVDLVYSEYNSDTPFSINNKNINISIVGKLSVFHKILNVLSMPFFYPLFTVRFNWILLFKIKNLIKSNKYSLVILDHSQTFIFGKFIKLPKLLIAHDIIYQRILRASKNKIKSYFAKFSEKFVLNAYNSTVFTFCEKDVELLRLNYGISGIVTRVYIDELILNKQIKKLSDYYVFFGSWDRDDNSDGLVWFIDNVYDKIGENPKIKIIGGKLSLKLQEKIKEYDKIEYLGFVDDPYDLITSSKALISPLFTGAGIKVKVIESFACGTPVIGTHIAFEGLPEYAEKFMLVANNENEFLSQMKNVDKFSLDDRINMKKNFVGSYDQKSIFNYIINHY